MEQDTMRLSAHYASYLINGDHSALTQDEIDMIDAWLEQDQKEKPYYIVNMSDETNFGRCPICGLYADLGEYTIIYR